MRQDFNLSSAKRATELSTCPVCTRTVGEEDGEGVDVGDERLNAPPALAAAAIYASVEFFGEKTRASVTTPTEHTACPPSLRNTPSSLGLKVTTFVVEVA